MSKTISLTVTDMDYKVIKHEAISKGLTPSQYTKTALFGHISKYPTKGVFDYIDKILNNDE